jgi:hypothetical protein
MALDIPESSATRIFQLFGELYESEPVQHFLASHPTHRLTKPSDGDQYVECKKGGFDFLFKNTGPGGIGRKQHRLLHTVFLYNDRVEGHKRYPDLLPFGFSFDDTRAVLLAKRRPVRSFTMDEGNVEIDFPDPDLDLWRSGDYNVAVFYRDKCIRRLQISLLPESETLSEPIIRITWRRLARDVATRAEAIRLYKQEHNVGTADAKKMVEEFAAACVTLR